MPGDSSILRDRCWDGAALPEDGGRAGVLHLGLDGFDITQ